MAIPSVLIKNGSYIKKRVYPSNFGEDRTWGDLFNYIADIRVSSYIINYFYCCLYSCVELNSIT